MKRFTDKKAPTSPTEINLNHPHPMLNEFLGNPQHDLTHDLIKQDTFLKLLQQGLEEGNDLPRLADYIDRALAISAGSTTCSTWWTPSSFTTKLYQHQQTLKSLQAKASARVPSRQTYGTLNDTSVTQDAHIDVFEHTSLLNDELRSYAELSERQKTQKRTEELAARAKEHFSHYERSLIGYLRQLTGIQQLEEGCQHLISAAQYGHPEAITLLKLSPNDSITVFNYAQHHGRLFIKKLQSIPSSESLYGEAQWTLFILYYAKRYQKQVYQNDEVRFAELQQALIHLEASAAFTPVNSFRLSFSLDFIQPDNKGEISVEINARRLLEEEVSGKDPFFDTYLMLKSILPQSSKAASVREHLESKPSQASYPFRILSDKMEKKIDKSAKKSMRFVDVDKNSADQFIVDIQREVAPLKESQVVVFIDAKKGSEVARVICDSQRFIFFAYEDSIQLTLSNYLPCLYYQFNQREGQLILQTHKVPQRAEHVELWVKQLVTEVDSVLSASRLIIEADQIQNQGLLEADILHIQVNESLVNETTARIHATHQLRITGKSAWNAGSIEADKKGLISLNQFFVHGATSFAALKSAVKQRERLGGAAIKGDEICVIALASINFLSYVTVRQWSLMTLAEFNIGLTKSVNQNKCRLITLDCGIDLPNLPQLLDDINIFSGLIQRGEYQNAFDSFKTDRAFINTASFARWVIRTFVPALGKPVDLAWTLYMLSLSGASSIQQGRALYKKWKEGNEPFEARDVYAFLVTISSVSNQVAFMVPQAESAWANFRDPHYHTFPLSAVYPKEAVHLLMLDAVALFAPTQTDDALLKAKSGLRVTGTVLDRSFYTFGSAHAALALNISNLFFSSFQEGTAQAGVNISETGHDLSQATAIAAFNHYTNVVSQETTDVVYANQVFWQTEHCKDSSTLRVQNATLSSHDSLVHEGKMTAEVALLKGHAVSLGETSVIHADLVQVEGADLTHQGEIKAKEVNFISSSTLEDAGEITADEIRLQADHQIKRLQSATAKTAHMIVYAKEGEIVDQGKMSLHAPASVALELFATDISSPIKPALSEVAKSIILAAGSEIEATNQSIVMQSTGDAVLAGKITTGSLQLQASAAIQLQETGTITAESFSANASLIMQNSHLLIYPIAHTSEVLASNPLSEGTVSAASKAMWVDVNLKGSQSVTQGASGNIEAKGAVIAMTSANDIVDEGHITGKVVILRGDHKVERLATAWTEAEKIQIGTFSSTTIDNGTLHLTDPLATGKDDTIDAEPAFLEQGQQVTLNESYVLKAPAQSVLIQTEKTLIINGQLDTRVLTLAAKEEISLESNAQISTHRMQAESKSIKQNSHIISDAVSEILQTPITADKNNTILADISLNGSEEVLQGISGYIEAKNAAVLLNSHKRIVNEGHLKAERAEFNADERIESTATAYVIAKRIIMNSAVIVQNGELEIDKPVNELRTQTDPDGKIVILPDMILEGSQEVSLGSTGRIHGEHAVVQVKSANRVTDAGEMTAKYAYLEANTVVERTSNANATTEYLQLGLNHHQTTTVIDNGRMTHVPSPLSSSDAKAKKENTLDLALLVSAKTIELGETHQLIAPTGSSIVDASESLTMASGAHQIAKQVSYQAPTAAVKGFVEADIIDYQVAQTTSDQINAMLRQSGDYQQWHPKTQLNLQSSQPIQLHGSYEFPYSVDITGAQFILDGSMHSTQNLNFTATAGDITLNQAAVTANQKLGFNTSGNYSVTDSSVSGNETQITAKGNVINQHSTLQGQTYLDIEAGGDVENHCTESQYKGDADTRIHYLPATLLGGTGLGYEGYGLNVQAGGHFVLDSSDVISGGSIQIEAKGPDRGADIGSQAISLTTRSHRYKISERHNTYGHWPFKRHYNHVTGGTEDRTSLIKSIGGSIALESNIGTILSVATHFEAPGETALSALEKDVLLYDLKLEVYDNEDDGFWFNSGSNSQDHQESDLTYITSIAGVKIYAGHDIRATGVQIISLGKVELKAEHDVVISAPILNHSATSESFSTSIQIPTCPQISLMAVYNDATALFSTPAYQAYQGGTPTNSGQSSVAKLANASNLGIDTLNAANGIVSGLRAGSVANAIFPVSSMTVAKINFTHTESEVNWQTVDPNAGVFCGSLDVRAGNNVLIMNGVAIKVTGNAHFEAKHLGLQGGVLHNSSHSNSEGISIGVTAGGHLSLGAHVSESNTSGTTYFNQEVDVGGEFDIEVDTLTIDAGNINAAKIKGTIREVDITSHCDTSQSESTGFSGDTEGNINYQQNSSHTKVINEVSGITVKDSTLKIGEANLTGASFTVTGNNQTQVEHLNTRTVDEESQGSSFGLCGNPKDLGGTGSRTFASAIPMISVEIGRGDYRAHQDSTFSGVKAQSGLDSSGGNGLHVTHDSQYNQRVAVPLHNEEGLKQLKDNASFLEAQFSTLQVPENSATVGSSKEQIISHTKAHADAEHKQSAAKESPQTKTSTHSEHKAHHTTESVEATLSKVDAITKQSISLSPKPSSYVGSFFNPSETKTITKNHTATSTQAPGESESVAEQRSRSFWSGVKSQVADTVTKSTQLSSQLLPLTIQATEWALSPLGEKMQKIKGKATAVEQNIEDGLVEIKHNDWSPLGRGTVAALSLLLTKGAGGGTAAVLEGESAVAEELGIGGSTIAVGSENPAAAGFVNFNMWADSRAHADVTAYHTVRSAKEGMNLLNGIDPDRLDPRSRFGKGLYLSEIPETTLYELQHYNSTGTHVIRYSIEGKFANILDLTDPEIASQWQYTGGDKCDAFQNIATRAKEQQYNVIRFRSERGEGSNIAVLNNFKLVLSPQMITPIPEELSLGILTPTINLRKATWN